MKKNILVTLLILTLSLTLFGCKNNKNEETKLDLTSSESSSSENVSETSSTESNSNGETSSSKDINSKTDSSQSSSKNPSQSSSKNSSQSSSKNPSQSQNSEPISTPEIKDWKLVLANKTNKLPENFTVDQVTFNDINVDKRIISELTAMFADAKKSGNSLYLTSGYRSVSRQKTLYNNKINEIMKTGLSRKDAEEKAAKIVAPPGTSEHNTGLALDIVSSTWFNTHSNLNEDFENTKEGKWLFENAHKYGFILRYPKDKPAITGYSYEPWHYRYVGTKAALEIYNAKICLEEYLK